MGNVNSVPKTQKSRKKESHNSTDTGKNKRPASGNSRPPSQNSRDIKKYHVGPRATNPFIIFFLRLRSKKPKEHVTVIARVAGKLWTRMTPEQRKEYVDLANAEKKRRQDKRRKRKRSSAH